MGKKRGFIKDPTEIPNTVSTQYIPVFCVRSKTERGNGDVLFFSSVSSAKILSQYKDTRTPKLLPVRWYSTVL